MKLTFAASLVAAFLGWYLCALIPGRVPRGVVRAALIALLCSPGILVGHGFAVVPSLFALCAQPSIFTFGSMAVVWIIALSVIFAVPALRNDRSRWPPSAEEMFLRAYAAKFTLFGVVAAVLMLAFVYAGQPRALWVVSLKYGLFFAGAAMNLTLCYWATRNKHANPFVTPLFFAAPALLAAAPTVPFAWYGGGAIGGLMGSGRHVVASWVALGVFALLVANALFRTYLAATAASHVTIGGGVAGNAAMAALYGAIGVVAWWALRRERESRDPIG